MKVSYEVAAGADPSDIELEYEGADGLYIDADGSLVIETSLGPITEAAPIASLNVIAMFVVRETFVELSSTEDVLTDGGVVSRVRNVNEYSSSSSLPSTSQVSALSWNT